MKDKYYIFSWKDHNGIERRVIWEQNEKNDTERLVFSTFENDPPIDWTPRIYHNLKEARNFIRKQGFINPKVECFIGNGEELLFIESI